MHLAAGAAALPAVSRIARAQVGKPPTIGFLAANSPAVQGQWIAAFVQRLR
jgi:hypothetical protein